MTGLEKRIRWVLEHRRDRIKNQSQWAVAAGLTRTHVDQLLRRLKKNEGAGQERETPEKLADAAGVSRAWLVFNEGSPEDLRDARESSFREFLRWYYATTALVQVVDQHPDEITVDDLLRYREEPARHGEADPGEVYQHIQQLRAGRIGSTVVAESRSATELETSIIEAHDDAYATSKR